jgi:hypothetical protein
MTTYLYDLPTTGALSFLDFCVDSSSADSGSSSGSTYSYTTDLSSATQARANLRAALKECRHDQAEGERDYLRVEKVGA